VHLDEPEGTVLAFLPGQDDIEAAAAALDALAASHAHPANLKLNCIPLYAALRPEDQAAAFAPAAQGARNVVLATNIAETSVTLPGVRYVVDSGTVKARTYNAQRGVDALQVLAHLDVCVIRSCSQSEVQSESFWSLL
jgi:HrpA-like RNA helicase